MFVDTQSFTFFCVDTPGAKLTPGQFKLPLMLMRYPPVHVTATSYTPPVPVRKDKKSEEENSVDTDPSVELVECVKPESTISDKGFEATANVTGSVDTKQDTFATDEQIQRSFNAGGERRLC